MTVREELALIEGRLGALRSQIRDPEGADPDQLKIEQAQLLSKAQYLRGVLRSEGVPA
tara:strand:+ start:1401 stop:1574 length:174 start_codon:yes stop_codon:yes gene_type:complete